MGRDNAIREWEWMGSYWIYYTPGINENKDLLVPIPSFLKEYESLNKEGYELYSLNSSKMELTYFKASVGQVFHTTGNLKWIKTKIPSNEKSINNPLHNKYLCYIGIETEEGIYINLKQLMKGYLPRLFRLNEPMVEQSIKDGEMVEKEVKPMLIRNFKIEDVYISPTNRDSSLAVYAIETNLFKDATIQFLGKSMRQMTVKDMSDGMYLKRMKRIQYREMWSVSYGETNINQIIKQRQEEEELRRLSLERERQEQHRKEEERRFRLNFNLRNAHPNDSHIILNQSNHSYIVDGNTYQSVTSFVSGCFPKFETMSNARKVALRSGKSVADVLDMWEHKNKESRELGTQMHKKIENYFIEVNSAMDETFNLFMQFANAVPLNPYRTEWSVYDRDIKLAGTIDYIDYQNGKYIIYDWKRSNKLIYNGMPLKESQYSSKGLSPIDHLEDSPYYHYALQLSLYKYIVEKNYGIQISELRLGIFHPDYIKPYIIKMPYLEDEVNSLIGAFSDVIF